VSAVKASDLPARGRETERGRAGESDRDVDEIKKCFLGFYWLQKVLAKKFRVSVFASFDLHSSVRVRVCVCVWVCASGIKRIHMPGHTHSLRHVSGFKRKSRESKKVARKQANENPCPFLSPPPPTLTPAGRPTPYASVCAESSSTKQQQQGFLTLEIEPQTSEKREKTHIQRQKKEEENHGQKS